LLSPSYGAGYREQVARVRNPRDSLKALGDSL